MIPDDQNPVNQLAEPGLAATLRVIDANLNRADEALRVIEDTFRFVVGDEHLQRVCKRLRHAAGDLAGEFSRRYRLVAMRDSAGDVGNNSEFAPEYVRRQYHDILTANFSRTRQSLRTIEEFGKLLNPELASTAEKIRYGVYQLEKAARTLFDSQQRLAGARLCVLVDGCQDPEQFASTLNELVAGGAQMLQLRDKQLDDRELLERARQLVSLAQPAGILAIINDRVDIARATGANGVHLGQQDLPVRAARSIAGPDMLIGVSTHSLAQARAAALDGADYLGVGPVFASSTKSFDQVFGTDLLDQVAAEIKLPAFAIGGITRHNVDQVKEAGIGRVAVSAGVLNTDLSVFKATQALAEILDDRTANCGAGSHV